MKWIQLFNNKQFSQIASEVYDDYYTYFISKINGCSDPKIPA